MVIAVYDEWYWDGLLLIQQIEKYMDDCGAKRVASNL